MTTSCPPPGGDEASLYAQYAPKLARIVASRVRTSSANVDDACAFAWLQMLRHQPSRETLLAWLVTTGTREAIKLDRRARRHDEPTDDLTEAGCVSAEYRPIEAHLDMLAAREAVADAGLRPREAEILAAHIAGFSYAEIADAKCLTTRTVERQLLHAKHRLRAARERQQRNAEVVVAVAAHDSFECGSYFRMADSLRNVARLKRQPGECRPTVPISSDIRCLSESAGLATKQKPRGSRFTPILSLGFGRKQARKLTSAAKELVTEASVRLPAVHDTDASVPVIRATTEGARLRSGARPAKAGESKNGRLARPMLHEPGDVPCARPRRFALPWQESAHPRMRERTTAVCVPCTRPTVRLRGPRSEPGLPRPSGG